MDDETLVHKAIRGNDGAFFTLIQNNKEKLYRIAFSYFKNENDSLEAIQETTYRAYKNKKKIKDPKYFSTWLVRILINYCIDEQRKKSKLVNIDRENKIPSNINNDKIDIDIALDNLKPEYKKVIILRYFEDMTIQDISMIMESPEGTIKTWIHRALKELKSFFNNGGEFNV